MKLIIHLNPIQNGVENFQLRFLLKSEVFPSLTLSTEVLLRILLCEKWEGHQKIILDYREDLMNSTGKLQSRKVTMFIDDDFNMHIRQRKLSFFFVAISNRVFSFILLDSCFIKLVYLIQVKIQLYPDTNHRNLQTCNLQAQILVNF